MKNAIKVLLICTTLLFLNACKQGDFYAASETTATTDSTAKVLPSKIKQLTRKFVRTADIKFRVNDVKQSTEQIEDITRAMGGFVTMTDMKNTIDISERYRSSKDSISERRYCTTTNDITIRIPSERMDTTLKQISNCMDFLDHRLIKAEDVSIQMVENELEQQRNQQYSELIDQKVVANIANENVDLQNDYYNKATQTDAAVVSNLNLADQVNYSTVRLSIYQKQAIVTDSYPYHAAVKDFEPSFFVKAWEAISIGWNAILAILLLLFKIWPLWGLIALGYYLQKRFNILPTGSFTDKHMVS
ncbi:MAG: DUF4349 domain-containing protein [Chitinophagales bacterium]|nr:DUF4349 domain-containing protein [Chitinophagales bacterium]